MATITWPTSRLFVPATLEWGEQRFVRVTGGNVLGPSEQTIETPYSHRWRVSLSLRRAATFAERATQEAFVSQMKSGANRVSMHHHAHPVPYGTLRASPTLNGAHAQGATTISITSTSGQTLLAGDMIGVTTTAGVQLVRVVTGGTSNGTMSVTVEPALRAGANTGTSVVWDKPTALFRLAATEWASGFAPREASPITLDFVEILS
jgi:hypothetical protein